MSGQEGESCRSNNNRNHIVNFSKLINAFNYMQRFGWDPKRGLGKLGNGSKIPVGTRLDVNINGLITNVISTIDNKPCEMSLCEGKFTSCITCYRIPSKIHTIFSEEYESESEQDRYSLNKLPEVDIKVNDYKVKGLIDTGSQITAISLDLYDIITKGSRLLPTIPTPATHIHGAFGSRSEKVDKFYLVTIELGAIRIDSPVMELKRLPYEIFLGHDWLQRMGAVVSCGPSGTLTIEHLGCKTQVRTGSDATHGQLESTLNCLEAKLSETSTSKNRELGIEDCIESLDLPRDKKLLLTQVLKRNKSVFCSRSGRNYIIRYLGLT